MSPDPTDFLYPFIEGDEDDAGSLLADLARSAEAKAADSARLRDATLAGGGELEAVAAAMADRFAVGGTLYAFGNGGSATDAEIAAALFTRPPRGRPLPARSLAAEAATLTALGNDVGFELVFARQLEAAGRRGDIALAISTSGNSANLLRAVADARRRGMLTVGLAGYDGGALAADGGVDHCLVVRAESVHRIQEVQAALLFELWSAVQRALSVAA
jgi:D-sedoheptulose 7-phosphate isomerase